MEQTVIFESVVNICLLIALAEVASGINSRLNIPRIIGPLVTGIIFGPKLIGGLQFGGRALIEFNELVYVFAEVGAVLLLFSAGLHFTFTELKQSGIISLTVAIVGVIVPYGLGLGASILLGYNWYIGMIIGGTMAATSIAISLKSLDEMGKLGTQEAKIIIGAAVIDDVLALSLASVILTIIVTQAQMTVPVLLMSLGKTLIVWLILTLVSVEIIPKFLDWINKLKDRSGHLLEAVAILVCFSYAAFSGNIGISPFVGAFIAGMAMADSLHIDMITDFIVKIEIIFVPLFFVIMGTSVDPEAILHANFLLILVLGVVAVLGKLVGCGLPAAWLTKDRTVGLRVGYGMISRGEIGLVIASIGVTYNILPSEVYTALILMIFVTSIIPPLLLKRSYSRSEQILIETLEEENII
ncbi:cation:proton antiporter [Candidatus Bathyarchaeota archaeon]|nr:MAG: cation:proton antiporter [Candidatus Bathyarchaeota archaeon]